MNKTDFKKVKGLMMEDIAELDRQISILERTQRRYEKHRCYIAWEKITLEIKELYIQRDCLQVDLDMLCNAY